MVGMREWLSRKILRLINARYSLPTYLWAFVSTAFGAIILLFLYQGDPVVKESLRVLPFDGWAWSSVLTLGGLCAIVGMARYRLQLVRWGAMASFIAWLFGCGVFYKSEGGVANIIIFGAPLLVFWAYKYMASYIRERNQT